MGSGTKGIQQRREVKIIPRVTVKGESRIRTLGQAERLANPDYTKRGWREPTPVG